VWERSANELGRTSGISRCITIQEVKFATGLKRGQSEGGWKREEQEALPLAITTQKIVSSMKKKVLKKVARTGLSSTTPLVGAVKV